MTFVLAATIGAATLTAAASAQQANDIRDAASFNKDMDAFNAKDEELNAFRAEQDGLTDAARYQEQIDKVQGEQKLQFAANDVDANFGTAKEIQDDTALAGKLNIMDIKHKAHNKALGFEGAAKNLIETGTSNTITAGYSADSAQATGLANAANIAASGYSGYKRK